MVDLEKLKSGFWDGKYKVDYENEKGKSEKKSTQFYFDKDGIGIAIKRALGDFTDRTERLKTEYKGQPFGVDEKYNALCESSVPGKKSFVERFVDYFFRCQSRIINIWMKQASINGTRRCAKNF